jgi:hypothetical protein
LAASAARNRSRSRSVAPRGAGQLADQRLGRRRQHAAALAAAHRDQAHALQRQHRLAYRRSADAERLHQFALGRQLVAWREAAFVDHLLDAFCNLFVQLAAADRRHVHRLTHQAVRQ